MKILFPWTAVKAGKYNYSLPGRNGASCQVIVADGEGDFAGHLTVTFSIGGSPMKLVDIPIVAGFELAQ